MLMKNFLLKMVPQEIMNLFIVSAAATSLGLNVGGLLHTFSLFVYLTYQLLTFLTFSLPSETISLKHIFRLF